MKKVVIVGYGSFGEFVTSKLLTHADVKVKARDISKVPKPLQAEPVDIAQCDFLIPCIPLDAYEAALAGLKLPESAAVVDVCSVKVEPVKVLKSLLPNNGIIATHPLFGPQSASISLVGQTFVMCPDASDSDEYQTVMNFARALRLNVIEKTAEEHDREMAYAQGLTFFVARTLMGMGVHDVELRTPSFRKLLELAELEAHHSDDLFRTIQAGNKETKKIRTIFLETAEEIAKDLE